MINYSLLEKVQLDKINEIVLSVLILPIRLIFGFKTY
jgi:hypothetical protein